MTKNKIPQHIGIIMDGNRRWAKGKGLPALYGHKKGGEALERICRVVFGRGVKILTVHAFSSENWTRPKKEIRFLMNLLKRFVNEKLDEMNKNGIKINVIGRVKEFSADVQKAINKAVETTKNNKKGILNICLNYGGRQEIVDAVREILTIKKLTPAHLNEKLISDHIYTAGLPDPDLIIRTSGEKRISHFLTWQSIYSELYFTDKYWPEFTEDDLDQAIAEYGRRKRRFGGGSFKKSK